MAEVPYTPAPTYNVPNPLQTASQMQEMALRGQQMQQQQQTMEQQARMNAAKMAVGQHMQMHINPQTGDFDKYGFLTSVAKDRNASLAFPDIYRTLLENGEIEERTANMHLQTERNRTELFANALAPFNQKIAEGHNVTDSDLAGIVGGLQERGVFKTKEEGRQFLLGLVGSPIGTRDNRNDLVRMLSQHTENGRAVMDNTMQSMAKRSALVQGSTPEGQQYLIPQGNVPGMLPPTGQMLPPTGQSEAFLPEETTGGRTMAPGSRPPVGQGEVPSSPPAAIPRGAIATSGAPLVQAQLEPYKKYMAGEGPMAELEKELGENARNADLLEKRLNRQEELFRNFFAGPGGEARQQLAVFLASIGAPKSLVEKFQGGSVAAAQEALKEIAANTFDSVRTALPSQRISNFEVQAMKNANYGLGTDKDAINGMMNSARKLIAIAREEQKGIRDFNRFSVHAYEQNLPSKNRAFKRAEYDNIMREHLIDLGLLEPHEEEYDVKKKGAK